MNFKNKILIIISTLAIIGLTPIAFLFAQETASEEELIQQLWETIGQLQKQIAQLQVQIQELMKQPITEPILSQALREGLRDEEVIKLQEYLAQFPDIYPEGFVTGYFGPFTKIAVKRFQEKYAEDILAPLGLTEGTGYAGENTLAKLNELMVGETEEKIVGEEITPGEIATPTPDIAATTPEIATTTEEAADTTPPANGTNLTAKIDVGSATLSWTNPTDEDFAGTKIMREWWSEPEDIYDGTLIYDGPAASVTDYGLIYGITYYYKAFTYDEVPNYSSGAVLKSTPTSTMITVISTTTPTSAGVPTVRITTGGTATTTDTTPPVISNFQPSGTTTDTTPTLSLNTNEVATCRYASTSDKSFGTMSGVFSNTAGTYHYIILGSMTLGTYTYYARCQDTAGNQNTTTTSASTTFTIATGVADTAAPIISNIQATDIGVSSTTIIWQTDEESGSVVNYGLTASYGSAAYGSTSSAVYHEVKLANLTGNTTYHYKVASTDSSGNKAESQDETFTTLIPDTTSPVISGIQVSNITQTSATIDWTTNEVSNSKVNYSLTSPIINPTTITDSNIVNSHTVNLANLISNTTYYYTVASTDPSNNTAVSAEQSFTTLAPLPPSGNTGSIDLENSAGENQYLSIKENEQSGLDLNWGFTIEAWVNLDPEASGKNTVVSKNSASGNQPSYSFYWEDDTLKVAIGAGGPGGPPRAYINYRPYFTSKGAWNHFAVVHQDDVKFYANGEVVSGEGIPSHYIGSVNINNADFNIGADGEGTNGFLDGKIDEVRVWNEVRTASEIATNYNKELTGNEPGLVGYWKFNNELVNGKAKDETSNHNDLTLNNSSVFSTDVPF